MPISVESNYNFLLRILSFSFFGIFVDLHILAIIFQLPNAVGDIPYNGAYAFSYHYLHIYICSSSLIKFTSYPFTNIVNYSSLFILYINSLNVDSNTYSYNLYYFIIECGIYVYTLSTYVYILSNTLILYSLSIFYNTVYI